MNLNVDENVLTLRRDLKCRWKSETSTTRKDEGRIATLQAEMQKLLVQVKKLENEKIAVTEEKYMLEFKNQLLLEMVSVAQLDAKRGAEELEKEKLKTEALKWELANLNIEQSQVQEYIYVGYTPK